MKWIENAVEWIIFQGRWILAPLLVGLVGALLLLAFKFFQELVSYVPTIVSS